MLTVLQHIQRAFKDELQRHEMLQAGFKRTSVIRKSEQRHAVTYAK